MIGMFAKKIPSDKNQAMQQKIGELGRPKNKKLLSAIHGSLKARHMGKQGLDSISRACADLAAEWRPVVGIGHDYGITASSSMRIKDYHIYILVNAMR
jgi:hypothetical protein